MTERRRPGFRGLFSLLLMLCLAANAGYAQSNVTRVGMTGVRTIPDSVLSDSTVARLPLDPLQAWLGWPAIDRAIQLNELDGPTDIHEKAEIIADRLDDLQREQVGLDSLNLVWEARLVALSTQLEILEDLADVQLGGDLQLQQRIETIRDDAEEAQQWLERVTRARKLLVPLITQLRTHAEDYTRRADQLRRLEEESR